MEEKVLEFGAMARSESEPNDSDWMPAIVSIDMQNFGETYDVEEGFDIGTIFPPLNKPFLSGGMTR